MSNFIISIPEDEFWSKMERLIDSRIEVLKPAPELEKSYTINQARKLMKRAHETVTAMVSEGLIKTTKDGRIPESEIRGVLEAS